MANNSHYWQESCKNSRQRSEYLLQSGPWADCSFLVGDSEVKFKGHKLILAAASPVFEAMFYGDMAEGYEPIAIMDVEPDAFNALLGYIYTDKVDIKSFIEASQLYYAAKKYIMPHLLEQCSQFMSSRISPQNALRAYEFAKFNEDQNLLKKSLEVILIKTSEVLRDKSFNEVSISSVIAILDQPYLNIQSELELFEAVTKYNNANSNFSSTREDQSTTSKTEGKLEPTIRDAVKRIRFLTLTPQQFSEKFASSSLFSQSEALAILANICSPKSGQPMPEGFSTSKECRNMNMRYQTYNGQYYYN